MPSEGNDTTDIDKSNFHISPDYQKAYDKWKKEVLTPSLEKTLYPFSSNVFNMFLYSFWIVSGKSESYKKIGGSNISPAIINNGKLYVLIEGSKIIGFK